MQQSFSQFLIVVYTTYREDRLTMAIPLLDFFVGAVSELIADKIKDRIKSAVTPGDNSPSGDELTHDVHQLLLTFLSEYKESQAGAGDLYNIVTIPKNGVGGPYKPFLKERSHVAILSGPGCTLNTVNSIIGNYSVTIPPAKWTTIDAPDGTAYYLDPGNPAPSILVEERLTNQAIS